MRLLFANVKKCRQKNLKLNYLYMYMYIVFQVVDSTDLRDIKYIFKLDDVILDFSSTRLL